MPLAIVRKLCPLLVDKTTSSEVGSPGEEVQVIYDITTSIMDSEFALTVIEPLLY